MKWVKTRDSGTAKTVVGTLIYCLLGEELWANSKCMGSHKYSKMYWVNQIDLFFVSEGGNVYIGTLEEIFHSTNWYVV